MPASKTRSTGPRPTQSAPSKRTSQSRSPQPWATPGRVLGSVVAAVLVAALVFYVASRDRGAGAGGGSADAKLEHVHGLGIDPADGTLYAGSHYGLFRLPAPGNSTRVANRIQDFMGFTVVGPRHFLASGHPGEGQDGPSSVGLIETTDGGTTWKSLSLRGEADFHVLQARHGLVYGFNAMTGAFMVSKDKRTWETRSKLPMADFAVSPSDPDIVLGTTEQGLARSGDGGRTFAVLRGAPGLLLVSWTADGSIVGAEPDGTVHVSSDDGVTWQRRGSLDAPPEALDAQTKDEIYAAAGGAVLSSTDGGRTFTVRHKD